MLTAFEFVCVNERLVVARSFGEIIGVRDLNFHVERTIGVFLFNINVKTNALAVNTSLDSFFACTYSGKKSTYSVNQRTQSLCYTVFGGIHYGRKDAGNDR